MILINIKMQIRPEKMDQWLALADSYAKDVNSEDGCLFLPVRPESYRRHEFRLHRGLQGCRGGRDARQQPYVKKFFDTAPDLVAHAAADHLHRTPRMTASARWARSSLADRLRPAAAPQLSRSGRGGEHRSSPPAVPGIAAS